MKGTGQAVLLWKGLAAWALIAAIAAALLHWSMTIPLTAAIVLLMAGSVERRRWQRPLEQLRRQLSEVRSGDAAIETLTEIGGVFGDLAAELRAMMRDLREQRRSIAVLEQEMRDRVANRTDALERQISSYRLQASLDALTGLFNRRMLDDCLPTLITKCREEKKDLTVLAVDVDRFKLLNDTLGHAAGDAFLRSVGQILRSGVRDGDLAIRTGGDEFILLLPGCAIGPAKALGGRLAAMVDGLARTFGTANPPGISVGAASMAYVSNPVSGVVGGPVSAPGSEAMQPAQIQDGSSTSVSATLPAALLEAADRDLYGVKASRKRAA